MIIDAFQYDAGVGVKASEREREGGSFCACVRLCGGRGGREGGREEGQEKGSFANIRYFFYVYVCM